MKEEKPIMQVDSQKVKYVAWGLSIGIALGILLLLWFGGDIGR